MRKMGPSAASHPVGGAEGIGPAKAVEDWRQKEYNESVTHSSLV